MKISSELNELLRNIDYPCYKDDLIREAIRDAISQEEIDRLKRILPRGYDGRLDVIRELRRERSPQSLTRPRTALTGI